MRAGSCRGGPSLELCWGEGESRKVSRSGELWKCFGVGLCADKPPRGWWAAPAGRILLLGLRPVLVGT